MLPESWHGPVIEVRNRVVRRKMRLATLPLAHPLKALTRVPWTAWLSIVVLAIWCVWAFDSATHYVAPGLLDDGSFIYRGLRYVQSGYFNLILSDVKAVLSSTTTETKRFYELQFALVGLYAKLFGLDLRYWYLSNFVLCLLTAGAGFCTVFWLTRNSRRRLHRVYCCPDGIATS